MGIISEPQQEEIEVGVGDIFGLVKEDIGHSVQDSDYLIDVAGRIAQKLNLKPEATDPMEATSYERAVFLTGLTSLWLDNRSDPALRRRHVLLMGAIYPDYTRRGFTIQPKEEGWGIAHALGEALVQKYVPGAELSGAWFDQHSAALEETGIEYQNHILILPLTFEQADSAITQICTEKGLDPAPYLGFSGFANRSKRIGVVLYHTNQEGILHEQEHVNNDGFTLHPLGYGLNEGMAQYRALLKSGYRGASGSFRKGPVAGIYGNEVHILNDIFQQLPKLEELFNKRYESRTLPNSRALIKELINIYGITAPLRLFQMSPLDYYHAPLEKGWGRSDTSVRQANAGDFQFRYGRPPIDERELREKGDNVRYPYPNFSPIYLRAEDVADLLKITKSEGYGWTSIYPKNMQKQTS